MKSLYKIIHLLYAYTVACALGLLVNAALIFLAYNIFPSGKSKEILEAYVGNDGIFVFVVTLIFGIFFYKYTKKLNIVSRKESSN